MQRLTLPITALELYVKKCQYSVKIYEFVKHSSDTYALVGTAAW